jgi:hypothetical protein
MKPGLPIFLMAAAAVAFGMILKQCDSPSTAAPLEPKKVSNP